MTKTLRWGLVRTALIIKALIPPLWISKCNKLLVVASRSQEKANAYAREKRIPCAYGSYNALLTLELIDLQPAPKSSACRMDHKGS